ncbi:MAG TPA: S41 family peptidase [Patescibacteria group bacterium]|jgi:carboxyl-terminal processing protease
MVETSEPNTPTIERKQYRQLPAKKLGRLVIAILLVWLGGVLGVRYAQTGKLPLGLERLPFIHPSLTIGLKQTDRLIGNAQPSDKKINFDTFWEVWNYLERDYLDQEQLDAERMIDGAIAGMTASLGDPYTIYLSPEDNQRNGEDLAGMFYGVGIELGYIDGALAVIAPLPDSPAEQAGVQAGDLILHVKDELKGLDEDTTGWSLDEAVNKIRGGRKEVVSLTLFRQDSGQDPFVVDIARDEIIIKSVELEFVEHAGKKVAHLKLMKFGERTETEWSGAVTRVLAEPGLTGIILDMRNNPGGFFDVSIDLAGDFFRNGTVVSQQGKVDTQNFAARGQARLANQPMIVLVNRGSASASEIVAGALRDNLGARLVGERTFGKGTVQDRRELSNGGGLHVTIGRWLLPGGNWIHDEGLAVDVEVTDNPDTEQDEVLLKGIEEL